MSSNLHNRHNLTVNRFKRASLLTFVILTAIVIFSTGQVFAQTPPTRPDPPTDLSATPVSPTKINLLWNAPSNNGGSPITGYKIEVKIVPGDYSVLVSNTGNTTTSYSHSGVITGKYYVYRVSAINTVGTSDPSGEAVANPTSTSAPPANIPPNPPTSLTATAILPTKIKLVWNEPASNGGPPTTSYKIERKQGNSTYAVLVANTGNRTTTYYNADLTTGTAYTYRVSAINSVGTSDPSNEASATPVAIVSIPPPVESPTLSSSGKVKVANTDVSIRYDIEGGKILSMEADESTNSLHIRIEASSNGVLTMPLPRALIDAKKSQGEDDVFYVLADKKEAKFDETKRSASRTLEISFSDDTKEITIYGTQIIPEFGTLAPLVLAMGMHFS